MAKLTILYNNIPTFTNPYFKLCGLGMCLGTQGICMGTIQFVVQENVQYMVPFFSIHLNECVFLATVYHFYYLVLPAQIIK